ncbi:MAG: arsenate reductase [Alphaproteobacteria bacterium]|nr:arsenate reductase [Alphaproteobacteria bacterium]
MNKIQVFGIPNCSSVKKARAWLEDRGQAYNFHDFKNEGLSESQLDHWLAQVDWTVLLNRKSTTWRGLPPERQQAVIDSASARAAMLDFPSLVKRPVLDVGGQVLVGVNPDAWSDVI